MSVPSTLPNRGPDEAITGRWHLDPQDSSVEFRVRHFWGLVTVKGHFEDYAGELNLNAQPAIDLTISAVTLQTGNRKRDKHLRSADFFNTDNYPRVQFASSAVTPRGETLHVRGRLSANGRSIPLELDARIHRVEGRVEIEAVTVARHRDLGMTYSPLGMTAPVSELRVKGRLVRSIDGSA